MAVGCWLQGSDAVRQGGGRCSHDAARMLGTLRIRGRQPPDVASNRARHGMPIRLADARCACSQSHEHAPGGSEYGRKMGTAVEKVGNNSRSGCLFCRRTVASSQVPATEGGIMPLYLDVHAIAAGVSAEDVAGAKVSGRVEAPSADAGAAAHRQAHGLVADEVFQVSEGS
jgi:hypothetical protein